MATLLRPPACPQERARAERVAKARQRAEEGEVVGEQDLVSKEDIQKENDVLQVTGEGASLRGEGWGWSVCAAGQGGAGLVRCVLHVWVGGGWVCGGLVRWVLQGEGGMGGGA